jgi:hypothetical protein
MVAEDRDDNFVDYLNGNGAQMIRPGAALCCEFR